MATKPYKKYVSFELITYSNENIFIFSILLFPIWYANKLRYQQGGFYSII